MVYVLDQPAKNLYKNVTMDKYGNANILSTVGHRGGFRRYTRYNEIVWDVKTTDEQKAIKIVDGKRAIILAANAWGDAQKTRELFGETTD